MSRHVRRAGTALAGLTIAASLATGTGLAGAPAYAVAPDGPDTPRAHRAPSEESGRDATIRPRWKEKPTGTEARLRGVSAVSRDVAWISGSEGTILRTTDTGQSWQQVAPKDTADLDFRDIEAFDADHAVALSIGEGDRSRVYVTEDGGENWELGFKNPDKQGFFNCVDFFDEKRGLAVGDPVDGRFQVISTDDGGRSWEPTPAEGMPEAIEGEANFSASGTCLTTGPDGNAWFATGGPKPRVFHTTDSGASWTAADTPVAGGETAGIFSVIFADDRHGLAVGGDFEKEDEAVDAAAVTDDGGTTWTPVDADHAPIGYRSGATWVSRRAGIAVAVGPNGSDLTLDGGETWRTIDRGSYDSADCTASAACWAAGERGRAARGIVDIRP